MHVCILCACECMCVSILAQASFWPQVQRGDKLASLSKSPVAMKVVVILAAMVAVTMGVEVNVTDACRWAAKCINSGSKCQPCTKSPFDGDERCVCGPGSKDWIKKGECKACGASPTLPPVPKSCKPEYCPHPNPGGKICVQCHDCRGDGGGGGCGWVDLSAGETCCATCCATRWTCTRVITFKRASQFVCVAGGGGEICDTQSQICCFAWDESHGHTENCCPKGSSCTRFGHCAAGNGTVLAV